jgi:CrcB protein
MTMFERLAFLGLAGACGTLARYGLSGLVHRCAGASFPWGTFTVNMTGCFLFGLVWTLAGERMVLGSEARLLVLTGFMGAFTTFSTFVAETGMLIVDFQWLSGLANLAGQNLVGLAAFFLGQAAGRWL